LNSAQGGEERGFQNARPIGIRQDTREAGAEESPTNMASLMSAASLLSVGAGTAKPITF
jgi:hypothetical protein